MRDALLEMMSSGAAIHLPAFGTFTLSLGGGVQVRSGKYVGSAVHVDGTLSAHRLSDLLSRLVAEGRLVRDGTGY